jgi:hypothetical protein
MCMYPYPNEYPWNDWNDPLRQWRKPSIQQIPNVLQTYLPLSRKSPMKVYLIIDSDQIRMCCISKKLAERICEAWAHYGWEIKEMHVIGESDI